LYQGPQKMDCQSSFVQVKNPSILTDVGRGLGGLAGVKQGSTRPSWRVPHWSQNWSKRGRRRKHRFPQRTLLLPSLGERLKPEKKTFRDQNPGILLRDELRAEESSPKKEYS